MGVFIAANNIGNAILIFFSRIYVYKIKQKFIPYICGPKIMFK